MINNFERWFRMPESIPYDTALQGLPANAFRLWVYLLCIAATSQHGVLPHASQIKWKARITDRQFDKCYSLLIDEGLVIVRPDGSSRMRDWSLYMKDQPRLPWRDWSIIRLAVFERDGFKCTYCGNPDDSLECDHIEPIASGGTNEMSNLTTSCRKCNRSKGSKSVEIWKVTA